MVPTFTKFWTGWLMMVSTKTDRYMTMAGASPLIGRIPEYFRVLLHRGRLRLVSRQISCRVFGARMGGVVAGSQQDSTGSLGRTIALLSAGTGRLPGWRKHLRFLCQPAWMGISRATLYSHGIASASSTSHQCWRLLMRLG